MKKTSTLSVLILLLFAFSANAQDKFMTKTGHVWFHSKTEFKEIEAHNRQITTIVDIKTGDIIVSGFLRDFKFDNQLVEEHFNENYVESHEFPKVKFKGKITNISLINLTKDGTYECLVEGDMEMHGKINKIKEKGTAVVKNGKITASAKLYVTAEQYSIEIPEIVKDKVSKNIDVNIDFVYELYTVAK